ncbi:programmed cell death protein 2 [Anoplophora glabripennis]|uniref:programmed cell death protein 2 n=1 Tax=Anoplophora glabripennis TaxID=217634 RepID=UPI000875141A|nr:programmed cell death protein 2 [Anoplophora glabripennis]
MSGSGIELGFLEKCEPWQAESRLFPSKVGGKPAWLDLENLPTPEQLQCKNCQQTMIFLCQIYAPYEENITLPSINCAKNFHRTLFVFVCKNSKCCQRNTSENFKVFRSSLQRANKFYPYDPPEDRPDPDFSLNKWANFCNLCGCMAEKQCSKCKSIYYCSRDHQVLDWREGHKKECCNSCTDRKSKLLFIEWEMITEPEEIGGKIVNEEELQKFNKLQEEGKTGTMNDVSETELDEHATVEEDKAFSKFQKRINCQPDQVIRYQRGGQPLWIAKEPIPEIIPDCNYCGGQRKFEFQIMPQMLTMLKETDLDWGVIAVYTCVNSCAAGDNYKEEFVFKQDVELKNI